MSKGNGCGCGCGGNSKSAGQAGRSNMEIVSGASGSSKKENTQIQIAGFNIWSVVLFCGLILTAVTQFKNK